MRTLINWLAIKQIGLSGLLMKIASWNVKGLGRPRKNFSIKELLKRNKAGNVLLQETKKASLEKQCFLSFGGGRNKDWVFSPADGTAGGYAYSLES